MLYEKSVVGMFAGTPQDIAQKATFEFHRLFLNATVQVCCPRSGRNYFVPDLMTQPSYTHPF